MICFQCDLYHFRNLKLMDPSRSQEDINLLKTIRRANLDGFWAREPGTVEATKREGRKLAMLGRDMGLENLFPAMGPFPVVDTQGMGVAVCMLVRSLDKGRYRATLQYDTVRKMRSAYSNIWHASRQTLTTSVMSRGMNKTYVTSCPTYGLWFERFMLGMHKRMGDEVRQDQAITLNVIHKLVEVLKQNYKHCLTDNAKERIADLAVFTLASFLAGLRGEETMKMVLGETRDFIDESESHHEYPHIVLPLRGRFKGETGEGYHFVAVSACTDSGLKIGPWVRKGLLWKEKRGMIRGFYFTSADKRKLNLNDLTSGILDRLAQVQRQFPELIRTVVDVYEDYGLSRSFRRGSTSEAINRGVPESVIDRNNRWRKAERSGARKVKLVMREHYTDVIVSLKGFLRYSQAL